MSSIFLDPVAMRATAQVVGDNARLAADTVASLQSTCSADVPAHLAAWLSDELHQIEVQATIMAVLYTIAAVETAVRAQEIESDQSLVAAWTSFTPPSGEVTTSVDLQAALAAGSVVGGYEEPFTTDLHQPDTAIVGGGEVPFTTDLQQQTTSIVGGTQPLEISDVPNMPLLSGPAAPLAGRILGMHNMNVSAGVLTPDGITSLGGGIVEDARGNRGTLANVWARPGRDGEYEVRS